MPTHSKSACTDSSHSSPASPSGRATSAGEGTSTSARVVTCGWTSCVARWPRKAERAAALSTPRTKHWREEGALSVGHQSRTSHPSVPSEARSASHRASASFTLGPPVGAFASGATFTRTTTKKKSYARKNPNRQQLQTHHSPPTRAIPDAHPPRPSVDTSPCPHSSSACPRGRAPTRRPARPRSTC